MFERYKINKLVGVITATQDKPHKEEIKSLREFGADGLAELIEAFRSNKIMGMYMRGFLETYYSRESLELFVELLGDGKEEVRDLARGIITTRAGSSAVSQLLEMIRVGGFIGRKNAVEMLIEIGTPDIKGKVLPLLQDKQREVKGAALNILSAIGGKDCFDYLKPLLYDEDRWLRKHAITAVAELNEPSSADTLVELLNMERDPKIEMLIIETLGVIGNGETAKKLLPYIKKDDMIMRQVVVDVIDKIAERDIIRDVINVMQDADVNVRRSGLELIHKFQDERSVEFLLSMVQDSDWWVREIATDALSGLKSSDISEKVMNLFDSKDENTRRAAVEYFNRMPDMVAYDKLIERLSDTDWWVREKAVGALGKLGQQSAIEHIIPLQDDPDVRWVVPLALADIGGRDATMYLTDFMNDPDRAVRLSALNGLAKIGDKALLPAIKSMVRDEDSGIRDRAIDIIKSMTGRSVKVSEILAEQERDEASGGAALYSAYTPGKNEILTEGILVLDLANSTEMGDKMGDDFVLEVTSRLVAISKPIASKNRVRFIKSTGDGFLMTFIDVAYAVKFSREITKALEQENSKRDENAKIDTRISIHYGETRVDTKGDRLGTAVNLTFRVEGVKPENLTADEGSMNPEIMPLVNRVMVTEPVRDAVKDDEAIKVTYVGLFDLKGILGKQKIFLMEFCDCHD